MFRALNRHVVAASVAGLVIAAVLAGPSVALACNGGTSAQNVYKECLQGAGGGPAGGPSTTDPSSAVSPPVSSQTQTALNQAGKDKKQLTHFLKTYGIRRRLASSDAGTQHSPSAVGSAFDLGSGPTALLIALAGTAFLLLGGSGMRTWRGRRRA